MHDSCFPDPQQVTSRGISRRKALVRLAGIAVAGTALTWLDGCTGANSNMPPTVTPTSTLYPNLTGQFGSLLDVGMKADFPAARPNDLKVNSAGVFYRQVARAYIVHLAKTTAFLLAGSLLETQLSGESILRDIDGSYWIALYQRCVHLGTPVVFRNDCVSFKCPSHGAHYHCDGEYLDGPAPRSMDRFPLFFDGEHVMVDTSRISKTVPHPDSSTRLLPLPATFCL